MKRKIEQTLLNWKDKLGRNPLLLYGARQVGKTYSLIEFGKQHFDNLIHINLDINNIVSGFFAEDIDPKRIIQMLEGEYQTRIIPGKTLIVLDEIQASERALASLKYFSEDAPEYHVAAAGSLLGVAVNRTDFSFPVGKVETVMMYPLDFEEYLLARDEAFLVDEIKDCYRKMTQMNTSLHERAVRIYREYLITGGMPACVSAFVNGTALFDISSIQNEITNNYVADMAKYAEPSETLRIRACYNSVPAQLGKENHKFQYKVVQRGGTATVFGTAIEWLNFAGIVLKCRKSELGNSPISAFEDLSSFKLYMADVGILVMKANMRQSILLSGEHNIFAGAVTENYVAQHLTAMGHDLFYWRSEHSAEVDFLIETQDGITAIEVKKGAHTKSKSLSVFVEKYHPDRAVKLSLKNFGFVNGIYAIPLYAVFCM
jgi:predicted AAA+ superfamily ATPase